MAKTMGTNNALRQLVGEIRERILSTRDTVCLERATLVTEADQDYADDPVPIRRAKILSHILGHMSLDLETNPVFAGNTSSKPRAWMLLPEYGFDIPAQALIENPGLQGLLDGPAIPDDIRAYWRNRAFGGIAGCGHLSIDNHLLLSRGLTHFIAQAERYSQDPDQNQSAYREACVIACRAVIQWAARYAEAADVAASQATDPLTAALLRRVAKACRRVPAEPARDLFEALQSMALVHLAIHIEGHGYSVSPGRLDQLLRPYYKDDEDAVELIAAYMLKLAANSVWGSHSKTQPHTIGGVDQHGHDQCHPLTFHILDACELARVPDPTLFLRWHYDIDRQVKRKAIRMIGAGCGMPMLVGDAQTASGLINAGVEPADAQAYCVIGCNELGVPARLTWDAIHLNEIGLLRDTLIDLAGVTRIDSMTALLDQLKAKAVERLRQQIDAKREYDRRSASMVPTPFTSSLMYGCVARGLDLCEYRPYRLLNVRSSGFTNLVNALAAIDEVVFTAGEATLSEVGEALSDNFAHAGRLRQLLLKAPKWGNDDECADRWAKAWMHSRQDALVKVTREYGISLAMEMVVRSLHHLEGRYLGATPDGRLAGEPLADSVGAQIGTARQGPTALLNSVCKLDPSRYWMGGYNLNLTLPPARWGGEDEIDQLIALVDTFFIQGGQELQLACLDVDTLREAKQHPDRYRDLIVRVSGFNARFIDLPLLEQDELIARADLSVNT